MGDPERAAALPGSHAGCSVEEAFLGDSRKRYDFF